MSIYVRDAAGNRQKIAGVGLPGPAGKSAYQYAVEGGFSGTEEEFRAVVGIRNNDNLLDNWYLADPINQRGQISYSGPGYMIDRWFLWDSSSSCTLSEDGVSGSGWMCERLENVSIPRGMQCTLSILSANGVNALQFYDETNSVNIVNKPVNSSFGGATFSVPTTCNAARIGVNFKSGSAVKAVKLELGPAQTLAHKDASGNWVLNDPPPNKALELAKCHRYYRKGMLRYRRNPDYPSLFDPTADIIPIPMRAGGVYTLTNLRNAYNDPLDATIQNIWVNPSGIAFPTIEVIGTGVPYMLSMDYEVSADL